MKRREKIKGILVYLRSANLIVNLKTANLPVNRKTVDLPVNLLRDGSFHTLFIFL